MTIALKGLHVAITDCMWYFGIPIYTIYSICISDGQWNTDHEAIAILSSLSQVMTRL